MNGTLSFATVLYCPKEMRAFFRIEMPILPTSFHQNKGALEGGWGQVVSSQFYVMLLFIERYNFTDSGFADKKFNLKITTPFPPLAYVLD